jgi:hypothetical protein
MPSKSAPRITVVGYSRRYPPPRGPTTRPDGNPSPHTPNSRNYRAARAVLGSAEGDFSPCQPQTEWIILA